MSYKCNLLFLEQMKSQMIVDPQVKLQSSIQYRHINMNEKFIAIDCQVKTFFFCQQKIFTETLGYQVIIYWFRCDKFNAKNPLFCRPKDLSFPFSG